jgi:hypothetical protein
MLLVDTGPECIELVLRRLQQRVRALAEARDLPTAIRCTYGIAAGSEPAENVAPLLEKADDDLQARAESVLLYAPSQRGAPADLAKGPNPRANRRKGGA